MSGRFMSLVVLIRHAHSSANAAGILSGQTEGVHLSPLGIKQSRNLSKRIGDVRVKTVRVSPMVRCSETITPWITKSGSQLMIDEDINEMDYGLWTGKKLRTLSKDPLWKLVQDRPSKVTFPQGESMRAMQKRAMKSVYEAAQKSGKGPALLVSHGDVIKSIIASTLGLHLDEFQRIVIDPASISIIDITPNRSRLLLMNDSTVSVSDILSSTSHKRIMVGGGSGNTTSKAKR